MNWNFNWNFVYNNLQFPIELLIAELLFLLVTPRKRHFSVRALAFIAVYFALALLESVLRTGRALFVNDQQASLLLRYLLIWLSTGVGIRGCFKCTPDQGMLVMLGGYTVQHAAFSMGRLLHLLLAQWGLRIQGMAAMRLFYAAVMGIVYAALYFLTVRGISRSQSSFRFRELLLLSGGVLINVLIFSINTNGFSVRQLILFRLMSLTDCVFILQAVRSVMENTVLHRELAKIREDQLLQTEHYETLKESIELANIRFHDLKHQLNKHGGVDTASAAAIEEAILNYDSVNRTGNAALDIVLTEKGHQCRQNGIALTCLADGAALDCLSNAEIYTLFGNILDNAIEAVQKVTETERRIIDLSVRREMGMLSIRCNNYYEGTLNTDGASILTTKADKLNHGYGLKSIRYTAEQHGGQLILASEDNIFSLDIIIPLPFVTS